MQPASSRPFGSDIVASSSRLATIQDGHVILLPKFIPSSHHSTSIRREAEVTGRYRELDSVEGDLFQPKTIFNRPLIDDSSQFDEVLT